MSSVIIPVKSGIDLSLSGIENRADEIRGRGDVGSQGIEGWDACNGFLSGKGQSFHRAHPDSQTREGARAEGDGPSIEFFDRAPRLFEDMFDGAEEPFGVGDRDVKEVFGDDGIAINQSNAATGG